MILLCFLLQCNCCVLENESSMPATMPDVCLAYRLLAEHESTKVSLRAWLEQFDAVLTQDEDDAEATDPSLEIQSVSWRYVHYRSI